MRRQDILRALESVLTSLLYSGSVIPFGYAELTMTVTPKRLISSSQI